MSAASRRRTLTVEMTSGSLWKNILLFSLPLMMTQVLEVLFNLSDVAIAGKYAYNTYIALGSVGSTTTLVSLFTGLLIGLGGGVNVSVPRGLGMGSDEDVEHTNHSSLLICLAAGVLTCLVCVFFAEPMLRLLNTKEEFLPGAVLYLKLYALGLPAMGIYNCGNGILSATGDTKRPLIYLSVASVLNVLLNLFFVIVLHMTVNGVAIATVAANAVSAALLYVRLTRTDKCVRVERKALRIDGASLKRILSIGLPAGVQSAVFSFANIVIQSAINTLGTVAIAASSAAFNVEILAYDVLNSFSQACTTFVGQNYGAGQIKRCKKTMQLSFLEGAIATFVSVVVLLLSARSLLAIFNSDPEVIAIGYIRLATILPAYVFCLIYEILSGYLRGFGISLAPALLTMLGVCGIRIAWVKFVFPTSMTFQTVMWVYPISLGATAVLILCAVLIYRPSRRFAGLETEEEDK